jgi:ribose transport system ATP-binding protein
MQTSKQSPVLEAIDVWKAFPGVQALRGASFQGYAGRIHGLIGENGAGKSTLMRVVAGIYQLDRGQIRLEGVEVRHSDPDSAHRAGISMVHQDTRLAPDLDATKNVWLGHEPAGLLGIISPARLTSEAARLLAAFNLPIDLGTPVRNLSAAQRQAVEIARALSRNAKVLILDEPTAALNVREVERLFGVLRDLRATGVCIVFVSHRLPEVLEITDTITVMKDGEVVGTLPTGEATEADLVRMMVGRPVNVVFPERTQNPGEPVLEVSGLSSHGTFEDISFTVRRGEIVGIGGIEGNGQRELVRSIFGVGRIDAGTVKVGGREVRVRSPRRAVSSGIAYVSNDRRGESLMLQLSVRENAALPTIERRARFGFVRGAAERVAVADVIQEYGVRTPSAETLIEGLSGGNQQKVAVGRWTLSDVRVAILDEPTQGVDVRSKLELYERVRRLAASGVAVVLLSSDLIEMIGLADRILVISHGRIVREVAGSEATEEMIVGAAVTTRKNQADASADAGTAADASVASRLASRLSVPPSWRTPLVLLLGLVFAGVFASTQSPYFLTGDNLGNLAMAATPLAVVAIGQALVILLGGIDLSVGATMSLVVTVASYVIVPGAGPAEILIGILICLLVGMTVGFANGLAIRYLRLPDLVVTLSSLFIVNGLALTVRPFPQGHLNDDFIGAMGAQIGWFPILAILTAAAFIVIAFMLSTSKAGISLYATGSSREAAFSAGIRVDRVRTLAYMSSGLTAAVGGLILAARLGSGDPNAGSTFTLASVTAVVVGGFSLFGGRGTMVGPLLGAVLVVGIQNVLNLMHVSAYYQYVWIGILTLAGVAAYSVDWRAILARLRLGRRSSSTGAA